MKTQLSLLAGVVLGLVPAAAQADISHRMSSSVQLTVDAAATQATRIGSSYSVACNNVDVSQSRSSGIESP